MMSLRLDNRIISIFVLIIFVMTCAFWIEPVHATSCINKESIITNVQNPKNGVLTYKVTVPPGEKIDYSVELTPDKKNGKTDCVSGSWRNKTKKTVTKLITANVKFITDKYKITASYSRKSTGEEIFYKDTDKAVSALKQSAVTAKVKWDFDKLGKGEKDWKYRYKYVPVKDGFKKYLQVFDKDGKRIKNYVKHTVSLDKITKIIKEMKK